VIFPALVAGGCLHVISEDRALDPQALSEYFCRFPIDILKIAPSHLAALQTASRPEQLLPRRLLILGGEASRREWVEQLQAMGRCAILNHYGPTEATVGMLTYPVRTGQNGHRAATVPLGHPLPNIQAYVLDRHLSPVPIGVPGELHIGGRGLARGYLNRPELTAEKFIADPFSPEPGARLYKTGDVVRYLPDGNLEFLGRTDHQVKIRGFRIELAEVESVLGQHPAVRGVVVTAREDLPGDRRLVAYVVSHPGPTPAPGELRHFLQAQLPDYMVPSAFVLLDTLPRTPHGKVDRLALPSPNQDRPEVEKRGLASRTSVEAVLAGIWAAVLKLERIGIYDNFFELGGDSILSIQIIARANQAGIRLTTRQLFQYQTVAELAAVAGTTPAVQAEQGLVVGAVPLTPIQQRFFEQGLPDPHHHSQALLLEVQLPLKPALLEQALQQLLRHHDALRLRFLRLATGWQQSNGGPDDAVPLSLVNLSTLAETEQGPAIEETTARLQASLHLAHGPLLRAALFDLGPQKPSRLLIIVHHLVIDGISWRLLLEDLWTAYTQLSRDEAIHLPPKTTSFKQWAELLVEHAQSETLQRETAYWFSQPWAQCTHLPVDSPGGANTVAAARIVRVLLSPAETQALLQEVPVAYRTEINDILLTALAYTFTQWTGSRSLLIELKGHGREGILEAVDLSRTVGWFTSHFPVLLELAAASGLGAALQLVKAQLRHIPNRGIGYGMLRYLSGDTAIAERLQALPQPEVSFNYLGQFDQVLPASSPFTWAEEASSPVRSLQEHRRHLLAVNGYITAGRLQLDWTYNENLYRRATIERLAQGCMTALRVLIADGPSPQASGYTPADFPEADLSQKELDKLVAELDELAE
jgi:non-ribosomal peptide synthase protein (TIGR01720 family)